MQYLINKMQDVRITMGKRTICYYWSMGFPWSLTLS